MRRAGGARAAVQACPRAPPTATQIPGSSEICPGANSAGDLIDGRTLAANRKRRRRRPAMGKADQSVNTKQLVGIRNAVAQKIAYGNAEFAHPRISTPLAGFEVDDRRGNSGMQRPHQREA